MCIFLKSYIFEYKKKTTSNRTFNKKKMGLNLFYVNLIAIIFAVYFMDYGIGQQNDGNVSKYFDLYFIIFS